MRLLFACPNWPADSTLWGGPWRRFGLPQILLISLLVHGLALLLEFDFRPIFPVDPGASLSFHSRGRSNFSVELKAAAPVIQPDAEPMRSIAKAVRSSPTRNLEAVQAKGSSIVNSPAQAIVQPAHAPAMDASDLLERSKAQLNAASRRQMLDPMFAPTARSANSTPLEKATLSRQQTIEHLDGKLIRVTSASGSRYCLQGLPEVATRDIPTPVISIPMNCP